ncbi:G2/M phase-specific E3 ubiquitin-protein ligase-like [Huso huso]|uniref:G2/M phase-specific E3 ubiquitin-protein ligase-like n=1 Tax=Huso huso TaxID=61971 RepID=A0ABR0YXS2_HUSHU
MSITPAELWAEALGSHVIQDANSVDSLRNIIMQNSTVLQTAGCFHYVQDLEAKDRIVKEYLLWYIIYRNHFAIQR